MGVLELKVTPYSLEKVLQERKELTLDRQTDLINYINRHLVSASTISQIEVPMDRSRFGDLDRIHLDAVLQLYFQKGWANIERLSSKGDADEEGLQLTLIFTPHTEATRTQHISRLQKEMKNIATTIEFIKNNSFIVRILVEKRNELRKAIENNVVSPIQVGDLVKRNIKDDGDPKSWIRGEVLKINIDVSAIGDINYEFLVQWQDKESSKCDQTMIVKI